MTHLLAERRQPRRAFVKRTLPSLSLSPFRILSLDSIMKPSIYLPAVVATLTKKAQGEKKNNVPEKEKKHTTTFLRESAYANSWCLVFILQAVAAATECLGGKQNSSRRYLATSAHH